MGWRIEPDNWIKMSNGDGDLEKAKSGSNWISAVRILKRLQLQLQVINMQEQFLLMIINSYLFVMLSLLFLFVCFCFLQQVSGLSFLFFFLYGGKGPKTDENLIYHYIVKSERMVEQE